MKWHQKLRRRAGFTMTELLVVLAIVAILAAVAIPSLGALQKSMQMSELDAAARDIFVAAQDKLTAMKAAGTLAHLDAASDYESEGSLGTRSYLSTDNPADTAMLAELLPPGALEAVVAGNHFTLQFSRTYGAVLAVFYARQPLPPTDRLFPLGSDADARREEKIGYYAGGDAENQPLEKLPPPLLAVENDNLLRAKITVPQAALVLSQADLYLIVKAGDGSIRKEVLIAYSAFAGKDFCFYTLDALDGVETPNVHIRDFFDRGHYPNFAPGMDLELTAELRPRAGTALGTASSNTVSANSLFATRDGEHVTIACGRHLQNLANNVSGVNESRQSRVLSATQTKRIQWPAGLDFKPISTPGFRAYDGGSLPIRELKITTGAGKGNQAGLFAQLYYSETPNRLENIVMVNPTIAIANNTVTAVGVLVGQADTTRISNCAVYVSHESDTENSPYGIKSAAKLTGGLVGYLYESELVNSFAALPWIESTNAAATVGGLVGKTENPCKISNSYAVADQFRGQCKTAAMLLGECGGSTTVSNCYAVGNISAEAQAYYGFAGTGGKISDSYCAVSYRDAAGAPRALSVNPFGAATANCAFLALDQKVTAQNPGKAISRSKQELAQWHGGDAAAWTMLNAAQSHPYLDFLKAKPYPYPALKTLESGGNYGLPLAHHGSWPPMVRAWLAYYELYTGKMANTPGLYLSKQTTDDSAPTLDTLMTADQAQGATVRQDGYCLLSAAPYAAAPKVAWMDYSAGALTQGTCLAYPKNPVVVDGTDYYLYFLPKEALIASHDLSATMPFYREILCDGTPYWFNPHFPAPTDGVPPAVPQKLRLRSPRHLSMLGTYKDYWAWSAAQELSMDFKTYDEVLPQPCIGDSAKPYTGHYEAGGPEGYRQFEIAHLPVDAKGKAAGLFGVIGQTGSVSKLTLISPQIAFSSTPADAGILAGVNHGILTRCRVDFAGETLTLAAQAFGGMVGRNTGVITDGTVYGGVTDAGKLTKAQITNTAGLLAGFAGRNSGSITGATVRADRGYADLTMHSSAGVYGLVGRNEAGGQITESFATLRVEGETSAAGFAGENAGRISRCYANAQVVGKQAASGFVHGNTGEIADCYALLYATGDTGPAGGFSANPLQGQVSRCYAAGRQRSRAGALYGFAPAGNPSVLKDSFYLQGVYTAPQAGKPKSYAQLAALLDSAPWAQWVLRGDGAQPYTPALGTAYPFPQLKPLTHVGDWPPTPMPANLAYFEHYEDGSYGVYGRDESDVPRTTLRGDRPVASWGYGLLLPPEEVTGVRCTYNGQSFPFDSTAKIPIGTLQLYPFTHMDTLKTALDGVGQNPYSVIVGFTQGSTTAYYAFAPGFATAPVRVNGEEAYPAFGAAESYPLEVRTADQLTRFGFQKPHNPRSYVQTRDIALTESWQSLGTVETGAIYDGGAYRITGLRDKPLFTVISAGATVKNVRLADAKGTFNAGQNTGLTGVFVLENLGTIDACHIENLQAVKTSWGDLAGFVGRNGGAIKNCTVAAADKATYADCTITANNWSSDAAGFVVHNYGTISNCFFFGTVQTQKGVSAGFAYSNEKVIEKCTTDCLLPKGSYRYSFLWMNQSSATVRDCSGKGKKTSKMADFMYLNRGTITNCTNDGNPVG